MKLNKAITVTTLVSLLMMSFMASSGSFLVPLTKKNQGVNNPILINDSIIYRNDSSEVVINRGTTLSSFKPENNGKPFTTSSLLKNGSSVFFIDFNDENKLWKTDGESFEKVFDKKLRYISKYNGNVIYAEIKDSNSFIFINDDNQISEIDLSSSNLANLEFSSDVCQIEGNKLVFEASKPGVPSQYFFYDDGEIKELLLPYAEGEHVNPRFSLSHGKRCFYQKNGHANKTSQLFMVNANGDVINIESEDENSFFTSPFVFNDQLFILKKSIYGSVSGDLYTLEEGSETLTVGATLVTSEDGITSGLNGPLFWMNEDFLYIYTHGGCFYYPNPVNSSKCSPLPYDYNRVLVFNKNLELVSIIYDDSQAVLSVATQGNQNFLIGSGGLTSISRMSNGKVTTTVKDASFKFLDTLGESGDKAYIYGLNKFTNKKNIYVLSKTSLVSHQLGGLWNSPDWMSQGLSIHTGTRKDQSEYLFVSFYLYKNGLPFWVAGLSDMNAGEESVSFDLFEYTGTSFLPNDNGLDEQRLPFGQLKITPKTCHTLSIEIQIEGENNSVELEMNRIVNTQIDNLCADTISEN